MGSEIWWQERIQGHLGIYNIVQLDAKLKVQGLTISFAIMNDFGDIGRLKCRLIGIDQHHPSPNGINQIYSIWTCKLHDTESSITTEVNSLAIETNDKWPFS
ncbi:hypothetical protein ACFX11_001445 [Malus domestica]